MNAEKINPADLVDRQIGPVKILFGHENGKYPHGNSLVVYGRNQTAMIDPCLGVVVRKDNLPEVDMVIHSHTHEDHIAGTSLFPDVPWYAHSADALGLESIDGLMAMYGLSSGALYEDFKRDIETTFNYPGPASVVPFEDGHVFDLGDVQISVVHTPGHTRGHCCLLIDWGEASDEKLVYLGDIELTGFGAYYGDAWSDLEDFEESMKKLHHIDADWWLTFHHKGLIESRARFLEMLDTFAAVIESRESKMLDFISEPRTLADIVAHRFVYRPGHTGMLVDQIEERSMSFPLDRLKRDGRVLEDKGYYRASNS